MPLCGPGSMKMIRRRTWFFFEDEHEYNDDFVPSYWLRWTGVRFLRCLRTL
jgi:hypothetical protein